MEPGVSRVPEVPEIDERELRAAQGIVGAALLGAFVFQMPLLVAAITVIVAVGAAVGPRAHAFHALYRAVLGPRLRRGEVVVPQDHARLLDVLATVLLGLACVAFALGIDVVAWFFVLVEAVVAVVAATTGYNAAVVGRDRFRP